MKQIPIGLEALRMVEYKSPAEPWTREAWIELGNIIDGCCEKVNGCENCNGCRGECHRRLTDDMQTSPRKWGYNEKAGACSSGAGYKGKDKSESWIPTFTTGFKDGILRY